MWKFYWRVVSWPFTWPLVQEVVPFLRYWNPYRRLVTEGDECHGLHIIHYIKIKDTSLRTRARSVESTRFLIYGGTVESMLLACITWDRKKYRATKRNQRERETGPGHKPDALLQCSIAHNAHSKTDGRDCNYRWLSGVCVVDAQVQWCALYQRNRLLEWLQPIYLRNSVPIIITYSIFISRSTFHHAYQSLSHTPYSSHGPHSIMDTNHYYVIHIHRTAHISSCILINVMYSICIAWPGKRNGNITSSALALISRAIPPLNVIKARYFFISTQQYFLANSCLALIELPLPIHRVRWNRQTAYAVQNKIETRASATHV